MLNKAFDSYVLQEQEGATLVVSAKFDLVSVRNIYLQFEEVSCPALNGTYFNLVT